MPARERALDRWRTRCEIRRQRAGVMCCNYNLWHGSIQQAQCQAGRITSRGDDRVEQGAPSLATRFIGVRGEAFKRDEQANDLLFPDLARTADAVVGEAGKLS